MRVKQIELLQSPWLIELGAFYLNFSGSDMGEPGEFFNKFSCDLSDTQPVMAMTLLNSKKYEYSLICAVCLVRISSPPYFETLFLGIFLVKEMQSLYFLNN